MIKVMSGKKKVHKVVIVGGGFAGVKAALNLANIPGFKVQLISDNTHFEYHGALYRSAVGHSPMEVVIPLKDIFKKAENVELILDRVAFLDSKKKRVASDTGNIYRYDSVIFALGNTVNYFGIHGLAQHTATMHDIGSTIRLRKQLIELFKEPQKQPVRIAVVGAGASGVELAAEIPDFAKFVAKKHGIKTPRVKVILIEGSDRVLPLLSPKASAKSAKRLQALNVEMHLNIKVESCDSGTICMSAGNLGADLIIWTAGSKPVDFYSAHPSIFTLGRGGRVTVGDFLEVQGQKDVYVLGDNADTRYSGMAQTALHDANFVSKNLIRAQTGKPRKIYRARKPLYVITIGKNWAVVEKGQTIITGRAGWSVRRQADLEIFKNFQPYKQAIKTWRQAKKMAAI